MTPGIYRQITGNTALAYGLIAAAKLSRARPLPRRLPDHARELGSSRSWRGYKSFGVRTFQAEDEIAAVGAALGAAFGGSLGVTTSAGPGSCSSRRRSGSRITLELPLSSSTSSAPGPRPGCRRSRSRPTC